MQKIQFTRYQPQFFDTCLQIFDSNIGDYFALHERQDFIDFLNQLTDEDQYYVGLYDNQVVCSGGWGQKSDGCYLRWGMLDKGKHKLGLGRQLLEFRLNKIKSDCGDVDVLITTSSAAQGFFRHYGFETMETTVNGIAEGLDQVEMRKRG
ncbi:GNAT family N-acetyltransferase [Aliikangiella marina]|uniref:GNAT family N-acetyltransferase n=1 Tax=Aliikangiella marina TaxID=1712262 RepID=A0A545T8Y9_9GAMM|nr:GNAT family N-acetyltransferase [Aliikangiella marina]TQV73684.1 GNAT family N-acetyltransferase [Aliikangiella marina]